MNSTLQYLIAQPKDSKLLTLTAIESKMVWGYSEDLMALWKSDLEVSQEYISQNRVVKVFEGQVFIGFYAIKILKGIPEIDHLWIKPQKIKQQYGRQIFQHLLKELSSHGYSTATLIAEPNAEGFYRKMGGKVIGKFESKVSGRFLDIYEYHF